MTDTALAVPICQVCGDFMTSQLKRCPVCDTPHHAECWAYLGRCAVYACTGTAADLPAVAAPAVGLSAGRYLPVERIRDDAPLAHFTVEGGRLALAENERAVQLPTEVFRRLPLTAPETFARLPLAGVCAAAIAFVAMLVHVGFLPVSLIPWLYGAAFGAIVPLVMTASYTSQRWRDRSRLAWLVREPQGQLAVHSAGATDRKSGELQDQHRQHFGLPVSIALVHTGRDGRLAALKLVAWTAGRDRLQQGAFTRMPDDACDLIEPWLDAVSPADRPSEKTRQAAALGQRLASFLGVPFEEHTIL